MSKCPWNSVKRNIIIIQTLLNSGAQKMDFSVLISDNVFSVLTIACLAKSTLVGSSCVC